MANLKQALQIYDICSFLEGEHIRLGIGGFYPRRIKRTFIVNLVTVFAYIITIAQMAVVINFVLSITDIVTITEVLLFSMTQVGFVNKLVNFHRNSRKVATLDELISQEIFTRVTVAEMDIMKTSFQRCQKVLNIFLLSCFGVTLLYGVVPAVNGIMTGTKMYPFPGKFPFNPDDYFVLIYGGEVATVAVSAWNNGAMDCLFTKHTVIATTLFRILRKKIKDLHYNTNEGERPLENRIKHCVRYYNEIIKYVSAIENIFAYGILVQFMCSAIVICLTGFQLLVVASESGQSGLLVVYLFCMMFQLVLYCWYGHMLMEESNRITEACYAINWHEMKIGQQKMLITIMERAKKPIALKALGIFRLNLSTLMTILRSSYSYFAVLQQIYRNDKIMALVTN
uniref:Odorant receptor n=1 Tax=Dendroctonus ponderosae TaxID=77166 RepID=R9PST7_DENPD